MRAPRPVGREALARHGWGERLGRLLAELEVELPPLARPVRIEVHPVFHYAKEDRILR
jgi:hypothetical protein